MSEKLQFSQKVASNAVGFPPVEAVAEEFAVLKAISSGMVGNRQNRVSNVQDASLPAMPRKLPPQRRHAPRSTPTNVGDCVRGQARRLSGSLGGCPFGDAIGGEWVRIRVNASLSQTNGSTAVCLHETVWPNSTATFRA